MCSRRNVFLLPSGGKEHLHFVVTDPVGEKVLIVGITSSVLEVEFTLNRGDHPFIRHQSCINYRKAQIISTDVIKRCLNEGLWRRQRDAREAIIQKISEGVLKSSRSPERIRNFYRIFLKNKTSS